MLGEVRSLSSSVGVGPTPSKEYHRRGNTLKQLPVTGDGDRRHLFYISSTDIDWRRFLLFSD